MGSLKFWFVSFPKLVLALIRKKKWLDRSQTYFPELKERQKSRLAIFFDQVRHIIRWHAIEENYYLYGFDIKGLRKQNEYLDYGYFMRRRDYLNNHPDTKEPYSYTGVLRDKFYFSIFMEQFGFPIPATIGLMDAEGIYMLKEKARVPLTAFNEMENHVICKPLDGIGGVGIFSLNLRKGTMECDGESIDMDELKKKLGKGCYFVQEKIQEQHPLMASLYPNSINTLRVTTVRDPHTGEIELMGVMLLMGARGAIVSNWHYGGVIIDVHDDGYLDKYGYSLYEKKIDRHPETGVVFESFKVPYFNEVVAAAKQCHRMFYGVHSVGWDFAILPDGYLFIEGNDNWGMAAHQMVNGGLVEKFNRYYK